MSWVEAILRLIGEGFECLMWREDWNRTWSPVSFWLALISFLTIILLGVLYGHELWHRAQTLLGRA